MKILLLSVRLYAPWVHSLKEKRSEIQSVMNKVKNKFNVSVAETGSQDTHQTLSISFASIVADNRQCDSVSDNILRFIEINSEAEIMDITKEIY